MIETPNLTKFLSGTLNKITIPIDVNTIINIQLTKFSFLNFNVIPYPLGLKSGIYIVP